MAQRSAVGLPGVTHADGSVGALKREGWKAGEASGIGFSGDRAPVRPTELRPVREAPASKPMKEVMAAREEILAVNEETLEEALEAAADARRRMTGQADRETKPRFSGPARTVITGLGWLSIAAGAVLIAGLVAQSVPDRRASHPAEEAPAQGSRPVVATAPVARRKPSIYSVGPDTSGYRKPGDGANAAMASGKTVDLVGGNTKDELMDAYDRVGSAVQGFGDVKPQEVLRAAGQVTGGKGCPMQWENGRPALMFGKGSDLGGLNHSMADCEQTITHLRIQKPPAPVEAESGGWRSLFSGWGR